LKCENVDERTKWISAIEEARKLKKDRSSSISRGSGSIDEEGLKGFLMKKSPKINNWKKRFFFVRDFELVYREPGGSGQLGNIVISKIDAVRPYEDKDRKDYCFQIDTVDRIFFFLRHPIIQNELCGSMDSTNESLNIKLQI